LTNLNSMMMGWGSSMNHEAVSDIVADWRVFSASARVLAADTEAGMVRVTWDDGRVSRFHVMWLRDNCPCPECVSPLTREQSFEIADAPDDLKPAQAGADRFGGLSVVWSDGHRSRFDAGWLRANANDEASRAERRGSAAKSLWGGAPTGKLPTFDYDAVVSDDRALLDWLRIVRDIGLTLVRGVPAEPGAVARLAERISFIRRSNFGVLFDVASKPNPDSSAYTSVNLPPHTDLPTRELQPGVQFLHCLVSGAVGGDSIFVDGFAIADTLRRTHPEDFALLSSIPMPFWNKDTRTDYRCSAPVIQVDREGDVSEVRCANFLRGPLDAPEDQVAAYYRAFRHFIRLGRESRFRVQRRLEPGDAWVFDNRRVLHARTAFDPSTGQRHLQGCYVDRDELLSRIRILERETLSGYSGKTP
jgi:gamma-butyrobetaine dioxygenase